MDVRSADRSSRRDPARTDAGRDPERALGRVLVVASHRTIRQALRQALEALGVEVSTDVPPGREALLAVFSHHPQMALVDLSTDPTAGVETCQQLRDNAPCTRVVALVPRLGPAQYAARAAGAVGVVTTDASVRDVVSMLTQVGQRATRSLRVVPGADRPRPVLTPREQEVLRLVADGLTDGQISRALVISHKTVKNHLHHAYTKLGATGRTDAVMLGVRHGLIEP